MRLTSYSDQLRRNYNLSKFYLLVNLKDLLAYDEVLTNLLINKPGDYIPFVCLKTLTGCIKSNLCELVRARYS